MTVASLIPSRSIVVERIFPYPPEQVWRALASREAMTQWLMPNNFAPVPGHKFTFQAQPMGDWDGVVHCEVLEIDPPRRLRYSWVGGSAANGKYGSLLDSVVTWTLTPHATGTQLLMEHSGFRSPDNDFAFGAMSGGWVHVLEKIERAVASSA